MIICDHCRKPIRHADPNQLDLHPSCLEMRNAPQLIIDYYEICTQRNEILPIAEFVELWKAANAVAVEEVESPPEEDPPPPLPFAPRPRR
jgi:hypothetical protein